MLRAGEAAVIGWATSAGRSAVRASIVEKVERKVR
jgi:hypothetical protein